MTLGLSSELSQRCLAYMPCLLKQCPNHTCLLRTDWGLCKAWQSSNEQKLALRHCWIKLCCLTLQAEPNAACRFCSKLPILPDQCLTSLTSSCTKQGWMWQIGPCRIPLSLGKRPCLPQNNELYDAPALADCF